MSTMGNAVRELDLMTGHGCYPPQIMDVGSPNVFVNLRSVVRKTDWTKFHLCVPDEDAHHARVRVKDERWYTEHKDIYGWDNGRYTVFINGIPPARLLDKLEYARLVDGELIDPDRLMEPNEDSFCEGVIMTASRDVFFEDGK